MANTQRPPPPVLHERALSEDLQALSEGLEGVDAPSATFVQPAPRSVARGNDDDEVLDLSALAKLSTSATAASVPAFTAPQRDEPVGAQLQLDDEPIALPLRTRPTWLVPLLIGVGFGAALSAVLFTSSRGGDHRRALPQIPLAATNTAAAAPPAVATTSTVAQPALPANLPATSAPQPSSLQTRDVATQVTAAAPVSSTAPAAADAAKSMRGTAANALAERSVAKNAPSTPAPARTYAAAVAPSEPALPSPGPAATAPSAGPPVLVVRPAAESAPAAAAAAAPRSSGGSIDALLDDALSPRARRVERAPAEVSPSAEVLPATPSPQDVASTMGKLRFAMLGCAMGQTGALTAALAVRNDGRVSSAQVIGAPFAGTPAGRCMEGVLRSAHFARFKQSIFNVHYALQVQ